MPVITDIAPQKRRKNRYSIYVDGAYRCSLSEAQLVDAGWRTGDKLTTIQLEQLVASSDLGKALDQTYNYISYRVRSKHEVITYLRRKQYEDELVDQVVVELEQRGLIDDHRFAAQWVEERTLLKPSSRYQLQAELRQKRVAPEAIEEALASVDASADVAAAVSVINAKHLLRRYDDQRQLIRYLISKGFSANTAKAALEQLTNE